MVIVSMAAGASEEEITTCARDLKDQMDDMKSWLAEHLQLGAKEGCKRDIFDRKMTAFGMAKIECDKAGTNTFFDFPAKEYHAWDTMCPRPSHTEHAHDERPPEGASRYSKEKSQAAEWRRDAPNDDKDKGDGGGEGEVEEDDIEPQVYPPDDEL